MPRAISHQRVCAVVSDIGKKAGVVVNKADGKFASAHDPRRSFGTRWARRVKPITLMRLMRHEAIQTTMKFYVELDADDVSDELWRAYGQEGPVLGPTRTEEGETNGRNGVEGESRTLDSATSYRHSQKG